jgi:hypothetical protein
MLIARAARVNEMAGSSPHPPVTESEANIAGAEHMADIVRELSYAGGAKSANISLRGYLASDPNNACGYTILTAGGGIY